MCVSVASAVSTTSDLTITQADLLSRHWFLCLNSRITAYTKYPSTVHFSLLPKFRWFKINTPAGMIKGTAAARSGNCDIEQPTVLNKKKKKKKGLVWPSLYPVLLFTSAPRLPLTPKSLKFSSASFVSPSSSLCATLCSRRTRLSLWCSALHHHAYVHTLI